MIDYLTHYYQKGSQPFKSLSSLPDKQAITIMQELCDDTPFGERFTDPAGYLKARKESEHWVRKEFIIKGGKPLAFYPISMVLGSSRWMDRISPDKNLHAEIKIPLSTFSESDVSFTYPDSMISRWFSLEKPAGLYNPEYHGKIFTRSEILSVVKELGLPEDNWNTNLPEHLAPYIEAQVWNHQLLNQFL